MKKSTELLISPSLFTLFVFLLINKNWYKADYILLDRIPKSVVKNLRREGAKVIYIYSGDSIGKSLFSKVLRIIIRNFEHLRLWWIYKGEYKYSRIYGNDEIISSVPFRKFGITVIEDGSFNLQSKDFFEARVKKMHKYILTRLMYKNVCSYIPYGYDNFVNKIILTHEKGIDSNINHKVERVCLKTLWESKGKVERTAIQNVFGMSSDLVNSLNNYSTVLLTQPFGKKEGGFMPEKDKVSIYFNLLKGSSYNSLLIKTHYAEKTNYRKYFKDSLVIDQPIPFQFFELFNYHPSKVITISSSAALKYKNENCEIIFTGTEIDKRIVEMYGIVRL
ncbi:MAG TPA: glycosyltransferase family 52 [Hanamia sp.]